MMFSIWAPSGQDSKGAFIAVAALCDFPLNLFPVSLTVPEGEILESFVTKKRDKTAALVFLKKALKRHGRANAIVTDGPRSYPAARRELGNLDRREMGRWLNNRAENSHLPFRRRERAMLRFRRMKTLQKFASVHANVHSHFNQERHLVDRQTYKIRRSVALAEWQSLIV